MVGVGCTIKIGGVTTRASIRCIRIVSVVTGITIVGDRNVRPRERIDGIVVKSGWRPGGFRVAGSAIGRKLRGYVVWVGRRVVIRCVTAVACVGRVIVVPSGMTRSAIVGDDRVRPVQCVIIVVNWERGRFPARRSGMAHCAIRRDIQRYVVRVGRPVKIRSVAGRTLRWRTGIPPGMTIQTIRRKVRPGQREIGCIVVKCVISIPRWVAGKAG